MKDLIKMLELLRSDVSTQADMLYKIIKTSLSSEENIKHSIRVLIVTCQKYPDFKEDLRKYIILLSKVVDSV